MTAVLNNKIKEIKIKNFRKFDILTLNFCDSDYFSFAGKNGTGKTSILEAVNILFSERPSKYTEIKETDFYCDQEIELSAELYNYFFLTFDDEFGYERLVPCRKFTKTIKRRSRKERGSLFSPEFEVLWKFEPDDFSPTDEEFQKLEEKFADFLGKRQKIVRTFRKENKSEFVYTIKTKPYEEKGRENLGFQYMKKIFFPEIFYFDNHRDKEFLQKYNTTFANIVNEVNWRYKKGFLSKKDDVLKKVGELKSAIENADKDSYKNKLLEPAHALLSDMGLSFDSKMLDFFCIDHYQPYTKADFGMKSDNEQIIPVTNLGSGVAILISLAISVAFAKESKNPYVVLIDEPELHLQAHLQKDLKKLLKQLSCQTFVATHSRLFVNEDEPNNNLIFEDDVFRYATKIDLTDLQFRLLGDSIDDLLVPEKILLVEGKHDRNIILRCLDLLNHGDLEIQIVAVGGKDNMPNKSEEYEVVLAEILKEGKWYSNHIVKIIKIIIDNDVTDGKVDEWVSKYSLDKENQVKKISGDGIEYLFPESLVKECVKNTKLKDGTDLKDKAFEELIKIILEDDKKNDDYEQSENRVSKSRLNTFVLDKIDMTILDSTGGENLKNLINWITAQNEL
jgi:energy-coupling factor transporter ATP-binding protein EcfA2